MTDITNRVVAHPSYSIAHQRIKAAHNSGKEGRRAENLKIVGASGTGKTTVLRDYQAAYPPRLAGDRTVIPVAYVVIPSQPTPKQCISQLLEALHLPAAPRGTLTSQIDQFVKLAKVCGLELILFDEIQHFVDRGSARSLSATADMLKVLIERVEVPAVFAGAPRAELLFASNMQLRRRFYQTVTLSPFDIFGDFPTLMGFVYSLMEGEFSDADRTYMASKDIAERLFYATDGMAGNIADFLRALARVTQEGQKLNRAVLSKVFREAFYPGALPNSDPFHDKFRFERLTKPGEPFEPSQLDGDNHFGRYMAHKPATPSVEVNAEELGVAND